MATAKEGKVPSRPRSAGKALGGRRVRCGTQPRMGHASSTRLHRQGGTAAAEGLHKQGGMPAAEDHSPSAHLLA